ncbi:unnamed protein product, partial [Prunus brigantina]
RSLSLQIWFSKSQNKQSLSFHKYENLNKFRKSPDQAEQESVLRQEVTTQRSQETLNNITAMMQWQVNRQFRKDREAAMARIPNPYVVVQQLDLPHGPPPGLVWPYQENPIIAQITGIPGHGEIQVEQRGKAFPVQEHEAPVRPEGPAPVQTQQN